MTRKIHQGFTLIELLVVIAIISILAGLITTSLTMVRQRQMEAEARIQLQGLSLALSQYLADYGILGDGTGPEADDFRYQPALFLVQRPYQANRNLYIEEKPSLIIDDAGQPFAGNDEAVGIINVWGNPLEVIVFNAESSPGLGYDHTSSIEIHSMGPQRIIVLNYDINTDAWTWDTIDP